VGFGRGGVFYRVCAAANTLTIVCTPVAGFSVSLAIIARTHTFHPLRAPPTLVATTSAIHSLAGHPIRGMATLCSLLVLALVAGQQVRAHLGGKEIFYSYRN